jgi:hypothetical protein
MRRGKARKKIRSYLPADLRFVMTCTRINPRPSTYMMLASCQGKESNMKVMGWKKTTFAGLLSIAFLCSSVAAQDKPKEPMKEVHTIDASTARERQIELALSAAPAEVSSKATVYILGPPRLRESSRRHERL